MAALDWKQALSVVESHPELKPLLAPVLAKSAAAALREAARGLDELADTFEAHPEEHWNDCVAMLAAFAQASATGGSGGTEAGAHGEIGAGAHGETGAGAAQPAANTAASVKSIAVQCGVAGATVKLQTAADTWMEATADAAGRACLQVPAGLTASHLIVTAAGYLELSQHVEVGQQAAFDVRLAALAAAVTRKSRDQVKAVQTNFCNLRDSRGKVQFSPFIGGYPKDRQNEWMENEKRAGSTHFVVSLDVNGYDALADPELSTLNFYAADRWQDLDDLLRRLLARGLTPIVFLHSGDTYAGDTYYREVCQWWNAHFSAWSDQVVFVCGWETRRHGGLTANEFNRANTIMREVLGRDAVLAFHGSPESALFASHAPTEDDDPWKDDDEPQNWFTHCGVELEVLLFQTLYANDDDRDEFGQPKWWNRTADTAERFLPEGTELPGLKSLKEGQNDGGWHYRRGCAGPDWFASGRRERGRPVLVAFESVAWGYIRGCVSDERVKEVARTLRSFGFQHFGNGLPAGAA